MKNNLFPSVIPQYRIKEYNSAYDFIFGKDKDWILCTNFIDSYFKAMVIAISLTTKNGFKHEVIIAKI